MDIYAAFCVVFFLAVAAGCLELYWRGAPRSSLPGGSAPAEFPRSGEPGDAEATPLQRRLALALFLFDAFLLVPLAGAALIWAVGKARLRWLDPSGVPLFVTLLLGACGLTGVLLSCARHAWNTFRHGGKAEPAYWYVALLFLSVATCGCWLVVLVAASVELRPG